MSRLTVDENKNRFLLNGKPFFYLADTIWSAFTNVTIDEWKAYLKQRKEQGFNVLQINTLPQWDRCLSDTGLYPFETEDGKVFHFGIWNEEYYENAERMCKMAVEEGFQLALVVLWLNYVPGTWGNSITECNIMPKNFVKEYAQKVVDVFDKYDPIYIVSGDTDFDTPQAIEYYQEVLDILCEESPNSLKTMHIKGGYDIIPEAFLEQLDFYMFQSGHNKDTQNMAYILPEKFSEKYPPKPMINGEPCYEQMGFLGMLYGRFQPRDIRKAAWHSILAGACAGVTYGAHGVWNWEKPDRPRNPILGEAFDTAFPVEKALQFPGAWSYGDIKKIIENRKVGVLQPVNYLLENDTTQMRIAIDDTGRYYIYLPYSTQVILKSDLNECEVTAYDLASGRTSVVKAKSENGKTIIEMHPFLDDVLLIVEERCRKR